MNTSLKGLTYALVTAALTLPVVAHAACPSYVSILARLGFPH